jgi:hypothetical protein
MSRAVPRFHRTNAPLPLVGNNNGVVLYRIFGQLEGQMTISTFMFSSANNAPTQGQLTALLTAISAGVFPVYRLCLSNDWGGNNKETLDVVHRNDISGILTTANSASAGGRAAGHLPTEMAAVMIRYTAVKGQHGRGRVSLPGIALGDVTASVISSGTLLTALTNLQTQLLGTYSDGTNTWVHCIGSRQPTSHGLVTAFAPVTRYVTKVLLGTVRRRKIGRGK